MCGGSSQLSTTAAQRDNQLKSSSTAESWQEPPNNWLTVTKNAFEFQSPHVIESRSKGPRRYFSNVAKWRMTQERTLRFMYRLLEHIRCPKIQFPCNHFFKFTKQNEKAGNYRKKTTWLIFELSSEIHSEETDSKGSSSLAFSICSVIKIFILK